MKVFFSQTLPAGQLPVMYFLHMYIHTYLVQNVHKYMHTYIHTYVHTHKLPCLCGTAQGAAGKAHRSSLNWTQTVSVGMGCRTVRTKAGMKCRSGYKQELLISSMYTTHQFPFHLFTTRQLPFYPPTTYQLPFRPEAAQ